jgi:hypothetical protein
MSPIQRRHDTAPAREAMKQVCIARMEAFGQAGHAGKIKPKTCHEMVVFYKDAARRKKAKPGKSRKTGQRPASKVNLPPF